VSSAAYWWLTENPSAALPSPKSQRSDCTLPDAAGSNTNALNCVVSKVEGSVGLNNTAGLGSGAMSSEKVCGAPFWPS
jgi:hypothetical protein